MCRIMDYVPDMDFLHLRIMTMVKLLKWLCLGSVHVNVVKKSNNSTNNLSHSIPTKYCLGPCTHVSFKCCLTVNYIFTAMILKIMMDRIILAVE